MAHRFQRTPHHSTHSVPHSARQSTDSHHFDQSDRVNYYFYKELNIYNLNRLNHVQIFPQQHPQDQMKELKEYIEVK